MGYDVGYNSRNAPCPTYDIARDNRIGRILCLYLGAPPAGKSAVFVVYRNNAFVDSQRHCLLGFS